MRKLITAGLLLVALTGCGSGGSGDDVASVTGEDSQNGEPAPQSGDDSGLKYTQCMREKGIDLPDPEPGKVPLVIDGPAGSKENEALLSCKQFLPNGGEVTQISPEDLDKVRQYAQCMRDNGADVPDPEPDGSLTGPAMTGEASGELAAADEICQSKLPGRG